VIDRGGLHPGWWTAAYCAPRGGLAAPWWSVPTPASLWARPALAADSAAVPAAATVQGPQPFFMVLWTENLRARRAESDAALRAQTAPPARPTHTGRIDLLA
jgi:hypothetical protein